MGPLSLACSRLARQRNRHGEKLHVPLFLSKRIFQKSVMVIWRALPKRVQTICLLLLQWWVSCFKAFSFLMKFYKSYVSLFFFINISFIYKKKWKKKLFFTICHGHDWSTSNLMEPITCFGACTVLGSYWVLFE